MGNKRFWIVPALTVILAALAFYLPPRLSQWSDQKIMNDPRIVRTEERESLADSLQLTVAEKLQLLREEDLSLLPLPGEDAELHYGIHGDTGAYVSSEPVLETEQDRGEWNARLTGVKRELLALQRTGGLPELGSGELQAEIIDRGEMLYIDNSTQVSFLAWHMELELPAASLGVTVDDQTGKILSLSLRWSRDTPPSWGAAGAAGFGAAWRDYWGMDSVDPNWNSQRINDLLTSATVFASNSGDYSGVGEICFTYNGQTLRAPLYGWCSGGVCTVQWNT